MYYLLSHVNEMILDETKVKILESLSLVSSGVKALSLLPSIEILHTCQSDVTLATLLVSSIDGSSIAQLNNSETRLWEIYVQLLKMYLHPSSEPGPRNVLIRLLETELFSKLVDERQVTICKVIIGVVSRDIDAVGIFDTMQFWEFIPRTAKIWQKAAYKHNKKCSAYCQTVERIWPNSRGCFTKGGETC